jgi:hypothetical protein
MGIYIDALKTYNKDSSTWITLRKDTAEYNEVMLIMADLKKQMEQTPKTKHHQKQKHHQKRRKNLNQRKKQNQSKTTTKNKKLSKLKRIQPYTAKIIIYIYMICWYSYINIIGIFAGVLGVCCIYCRPL